MAMKHPRLSDLEDYENQQRQSVSADNSRIVLTIPNLYVKDLPNFKFFINGKLGRPDIDWSQICIPLEEQGYDTGDLQAAVDEFLKILNQRSIARMLAEMITKVEQEVNHGI